MPTPPPSTTLEKLRSALADRYRIEREIGVGGMATVYLAKDLRHDRDVALKLLKPELGAVLGPERFLSEIRVTAKLQHPNLLPLFDSGESEGQLWYVMPYVQGESLRAKMDRERQLSVKEAVRIATLVLGALDYAHRHGVIHRDLKPENILLHDEQPLVADFGIALAVSNAGGERVTQTGLSLGTPQYMSPEQATGERGVDARTDIYSLGAVLYEMLTGEPPHTGATVQAIIARLMTDTPRTIRSSRPSVPEYVDWAVQKALEKVPADRFETAKEFSETLQGNKPITSSRTSTVPGERRSPSDGRRRVDSRWLPWIIAGVTGAVALFATLWALHFIGKSSDESAEPTRFVLLPAGSEKIGFTTMAVSPDGREIVYVGQTEQGSQLFRRSLDDAQSRAMEGTEGAEFPAFSPDGKWIAFYVANDLRKIPVAGGTAITLASNLDPRPMTWMSSGDIVLPTRAVTQKRSGLSRVAASGGAVVPFVNSDTARLENFNLPVDAGDGNLIFRDEGPGGSEDDFLGFGKLGDASYVNSRFLMMKPIGYVDGYAIVTRSNLPKGSILAVPVDLRARRISGEPIQLLDAVANGTSAAMSRNTRTLVYTSGSTASRLIWVDPAGKEDTLIAEQREYATPRISPDQRNISFSQPGATTSDIWIYNIPSKTLTRLVTVGIGGEWTSDGKTIFFSRTTTAGQGLWKIPSDGSGPAVQLKPKVPPGVSVPLGPFSMVPDGSLVIYSAFAGSARRNIYWFKPGVDETAHPWMATDADEFYPIISPDGKWVAYLSDESAGEQLFVRPFPGPGARVQISSQAGASNPKWSPDGRTLYYKNGSQFRAVTLSAGPAGLTVVSQRTLPGMANAYDVSPDGKRLLVARQAVDESKVIVVENWLTEVRRKIAEAKK
jgi:serine/threonine protein kinase/Tol biopolymer transport system component